MAKPNLKPTTNTNLIRPLKPAVVFDLDNTVFDTAVRKHAILSERFSGKISIPSIDEVRRDFSLGTIFSEAYTTHHAEFLDYLESEEAFCRYPAPIFAGACAALKSCAQKGYQLIALTDRPDFLREWTLAELLGLGELAPQIELRMPRSRLQEDQVATEKGCLLRELLQAHDVVVCIGDRPGDIRAASANETPAILLATTTTEEQIAELTEEGGVGFAVAKSWDEVPSLIEAIEVGSSEMKSLRRAFMDNYASWLTDIDNKAGVCVTLATALSALSGYLIVEGVEDAGRSPLKAFGLLLLFAAFMATVLSLMYAISAFTTRRTSGSTSGRSVGLTFRHWIGALRASPDVWLRTPGNAIDDFERLKSSNHGEKARAHIGFFLDRYGTYDLNALENLRLFELRAAIYVKVYGERAASLLLRVGIVTIMLWVCIKMASTFLATTPRLPDNIPPVPDGKPGIQRKGDAPSQSL